MEKVAINVVALQAKIFQKIKHSLFIKNKLQLFHLFQLFQITIEQIKIYQQQQPAASIIKE